jgi:hypothetical protein
MKKQFMAKIRDCFTENKEQLLSHRLRKISPCSGTLWYLTVFSRYYKGYKVEKDEYSTCKEWIRNVTNIIVRKLE